MDRLGFQVAQTPAELFGSCYAKALLLGLISMMQENDYGDLECWLTIAQLGALVGGSKRTVQRAMGHLRNRGMILVIRDPADTNVYRLQESKVSQAVANYRTRTPPNAH